MAVGVDLLGYVYLLLNRKLEILGFEGTKVAERSGKGETISRLNET